MNKPLRKLGSEDGRPEWVPTHAVEVPGTHVLWPAGLDPLIHRVWVDEEVSPPAVLRWKHQDIHDRDRLRYLASLGGLDDLREQRIRLAWLERCVTARMAGLPAPRRYETPVKPRTYAAELEAQRREKLRVRKVMQNRAYNISARATLEAIKAKRMGS